MSVGTTSFLYDAGTERLKKATGSSTSLYPFGDDYEITNGVVTKYVYVGDLGVVAKRVTEGGSTQTFWLHTDRQGSIQAITNATGSVNFRRTYRPNGETLGQSGSGTESRDWIDQRNDPETSLTYLHARYYDPGVGAFLSPDPIGPAGGLNEFGYGSGDPVNWADRSGLAPTCVEWKGQVICSDSTTVGGRLPYYDYTSDWGYRLQDIMTRTYGGDGSSTGGESGGAGAGTGSPKPAEPEQPEKPKCDPAKDSTCGEKKKEEKEEEEEEAAPQRCQAGIWTAFAGMARQLPQYRLPRPEPVVRALPRITPPDPNTMPGSIPTSNPVLEPYQPAPVLDAMGELLGVFRGVATELSSVFSVVPLQNELDKFKAANPTCNET